MKATLAPLQPRLRSIWADRGCAGEALAGWCQGEGGWRVEIARRTDAPKPGSRVVPRRRVFERTFAWLCCRHRGLARDCEGRPQTTEAWIEVAMIRLMLRRLVPV